VKCLVQGTLFNIFCDPRDGAQLLALRVNLRDFKLAYHSRIV